MTLERPEAPRLTSEYPVAAQGDPVALHAKLAHLGVSGIVVREGVVSATFESEPTDQTLTQVDIALGVQDA